jgi:hypothetical protein
VLIALPPVAVVQVQLGKLWQHPSCAVGLQVMSPPLPVMSSS